MSPRFDKDPTSVTSNIPVFPKGEYEFLVGEPKAFLRQNRKGEDAYGVMYPLTCTESPNGDEWIGKKQYFQIYAHSDGALAFGKRLILAALGYDNSVEGKNEESFNQEFKGADWSFDTDSGMCGDMWQQPMGNRIVAELDIQTDPEDSSVQRQSFKSFSSVS